MAVMNAGAFSRWCAGGKESNRNAAASSVRADNDTCDEAQGQLVVPSDRSHDNSKRGLQYRVTKCWY